MFESYNSKFNLDLWEACDRGTVKEEYIKENLPEGIERTLKLLSRKLLHESIEYEGHIYDNFDQIFHIGSSQEFEDSKAFLRKADPKNLAKSYKSDKSYPVDFFIEFIDPNSLKRIAFMVVYPQNPFGSYGEKANSKIILFKGKAFAANLTSTQAKLAFMIKNSRDIDKVAGRQDLRISWHWEPRKIIDHLNPTQVYDELYKAITKLNAAGYVIYKDEDTAESFL